MSLDRILRKRSNDLCEMCGSSENLNVYTVLPANKIDESNSFFACLNCSSEMDDSTLIDTNHWRCLNESIWSEHKGVQIASWRMLSRMKNVGWTQDLLDMMYLEEEDLKWAQALGDGEDDENKIVHRDVNGVIIEAGDSVVLIKDLKVKGSSMVAKQGTAIRRISLDHDNAEYIEGKIDGQHIVIVTKYVKKI